MSYYEISLKDGSHAAYLVFDRDSFIDLKGMGFYKVMPSYHNPTGKTAFLMNIYTAPEYRKKGIGRNILDILVSDCKKKGVGQIILDTTKMGRSLYKKYGFVDLEDYMELK